MIRYPDFERASALMRNMSHRLEEAARTAGLIKDACKPHAGESLDILSMHARGWLLIVYVDRSGVVSHLVPAVEAWIEHEFPLVHTPKQRQDLTINIRAEQSGVHFSTRHELSDLEMDAFDPSRKSWHTFQMGEGIEFDVGEHPIIFSYHASTAEAINKSGINMTRNDEARTPFDVQDILKRLSAHCIMNRVTSTRIHP